MIRQEDILPYVNIKITREGATTEQKNRLIRETTKMLQDVPGKNPQTAVVVIEEVDTDNWGIAGGTVAERRKREKKQEKQKCHSRTIQRKSGFYEFAARYPDKGIRGMTTVSAMLKRSSSCLS